MTERSNPSDLDLPDGLADDLRALYLRPPAPDVEGTHLDALLAASAGPPLHGDPRRHRFALVASAGVGVGLAITVSAGLAAASGSLPPTLQQLAHDVVAPLGIDVPEGQPPVVSPSADDGRGAGQSTTGRPTEVGDEGTDAPPEATAARPGGSAEPPVGSPEGAPSSTKPVSTSQAPDRPGAPTSDREALTPSSTVPQAPGSSGESDRRPTSPPGRPDDPGRSTAPGQNRGDADGHP